jgi:hypothetical protein
MPQGQFPSSLVENCNLVQLTINTQKAAEIGIMLNFHFESTRSLSEGMILHDKP